MFTKAGIIELHSETHDRLDILLRHITTVPDNLLREPVAGFGSPTVWKVLINGYRKVDFGSYAGQLGAGHGGK
jgi:hypothetical protein